MSGHDDFVPQRAANNNKHASPAQHSARSRSRSPRHSISAIGQDTSIFAKDKVPIDDLDGILPQQHPVEYDIKRQARHESIRAVCFSRDAIESICTQADPQTRDNLLIGAFCRVFVRSRSDIARTRGDKKRGKWIIVEITGLVACERYPLRGHGATFCSTKMEVSRSKMQPDGSIKKETIVARVDLAHSLPGSDCTAEQLDYFLANQGELKDSWDDAVAAKLQVFMQYEQTHWDEHKIDQRLQEARAHGRFQDTLLQRATRKKAAINELEDMLSRIEREGEGVNQEQIDDYKSQIRHNRAELDEIDRLVDVERREWEKNNPLVFGMLNLAHRNKQHQNEVDKHQEPLPPSLRPGAKGSNPFNRRECMPTVLWGMPKARREAKVTEDIKPMQEPTIKDDKAVDKVNDSADLSQEKLPYAKQSCQENSESDVQQTVSHYIDSFKSQGNFPVVAKLIANIEQEERSPKKKHGSQSLSSVAASAFNQGVWDAMIEADSPTKQTGNRKVLDFNDYFKTL